jgi:hypothetical protein
LNTDVRARLRAGDSVWQNYFLLGAVWIDDQNNQFVANANNFDDAVLKGERRMSNSTIETFTQPDTQASPARSLPRNRPGEPDRERRDAQPAWSKD